MEFAAGKENQRKRKEWNARWFHRAKLSGIGSRRGKSCQRGERSLQFVARVEIARCFGGGNSVGKNAARFGYLADASQKLAELKVSGDVFGMSRQKVLEMELGRGIVA